MRQLSRQCRVCSTRSGYALGWTSTLLADQVAEDVGILRLWLCCRVPTSKLVSAARGIAAVKLPSTQSRSACDPRAGEILKAAVSGKRANIEEATSGATQSSTTAIASFAAATATRSQYSRGAGTTGQIGRLGLRRPCGRCGRVRRRSTVRPVCDPRTDFDALRLALGRRDPPQAFLYASSMARTFARARGKRGARRWRASYAGSGTASD
jgi:hypothetical protein